MKKFFITTFALTLFSTFSVFGASYNPNDIQNFLTINGKPIKEYNQNNSQSKPNDSINNQQNKPLPQNPSKPINPNEDILDSSISNVEKEVVKLVNIERQKVGLAPFKIDTELSKVARLKSEDMKRKGYFSHTSPTYGTSFDMLRQFNITYKTAGENIAKGQKSAQAVVDAWMNSEGHRRNILSKSFTHIGVGSVSNHWTQLFIAK